MSASYLPLTVAVMPVAIMPGRISFTGMPYSARRSAKSAVIMETPALEMQYSPRLVELVYADIEEILTMLFLSDGFSIMTFATACVKNSVPLVLMFMTKS